MRHERQVQKQVRQREQCERDAMFTVALNWRVLGIRSPSTIELIRHRPRHHPRFIISLLRLTQSPVGHFNVPPAPVTVAHNVATMYNVGAHRPQYVYVER